MLLHEPRGSDNVLPVCLPLWGEYKGAGFLEEVNEGANAQMILSAFQAALAAGRAQIDWQALGMEPYALEHIESLLSVVACAQLNAPDACTWEGGRVSFALLEGNVAATLMSRDPQELPPKTEVDQLWEHVFPQYPLSRAVYSGLSDSPLRERCQFGLSLVGFAALVEAVRGRSGAWVPTREFYEARPGQRQLWLAKALVEHADEPDLIEALEDYASPELGDAELEDE